MWVDESFIEYAMYISTAILDTPGVLNLVLRLVHVSAHVIPIWGQSVCEMQELIMPCTCSKFSSHVAWRRSSAGVGAPAIASTGCVLRAALVVMHQRHWDLRKSPIFCSQTQKSEPMKMGTEALRLLLLVLVAILIEVSVKKLIISSLLITMISKRKKLLCITEVPCLCVVNLIMTRVRATVRVEGTATSDELVVVRAVQVNAQASGH